MKPNNKMLNGTIFSIKPYYLQLILSGEKIYEFRNFLPKEYNSYFWIYESSPRKELNYIMNVEFPIIYPKMLKGNSYGIERYNSGIMKDKYAYKIKHMYRLSESITMDQLITKFAFVPPQAYTYLNRNTLLKEYLEKNIELIKLF